VTDGVFRSYVVKSRISRGCCRHTAQH